MSYSTAKTLEELGLLTNPCGISTDKLPDDVMNTNTIGTVSRLLNPLWAIEYAAANLERAFYVTDDGGFNQRIVRPGEANISDVPIQEITNRLFAFYNAGVFYTDTLEDTHVECVPGGPAGGMCVKKGYSRFKLDVSSYQGVNGVLRRVLMNLDWLEICGGACPVYE